MLETATSLGGVLIKACQFASTRPDLLPTTYIRTLAPLQDRMPPRPWPEIEKVITRELGRSPAGAFAEIEREPVAAASIAQVHHARLHDGREVAVKVQYPDIENLVATDLEVLELIVRAIARLVPSIQLHPIIDYLKETMPLELDFTNDILIYKHPPIETSHKQRHPGSGPHWKIPVKEWPCVLHRIEQGEPLRKVAEDYHVSYEAIRRVIRAAHQTKQAG
ncbi:MAG TPA: AarF/UbiB family protein [Ktedonobacteraceae bacterium]|nr:AarF/UbiB family protein [Ktedonobacteraceae bacterium]